MKWLPAVVVVVALIVFGAAPSAWAQTGVTGSSPAEGTALADAPEQVTLTFSEPVDPDLAVVSVIGADGVFWRVGAITATDRTLTMPVTPAGPAGTCRISYTIASFGGDPLDGAVTFTLTTPVPGATTTPPLGAAEPAPDPITGEPASSGGGVPGWVWGELAVVAAGVAAGARFSRRRSRGRA